MQDKPIGAGMVICVHGAGAGGWEWGIWARMFCMRGYEVIAPDLMPSAAGLAATRLVDYRAQVVEWCAASAAAPILIGASLGGLLALTVAVEVGAAALVLVNPVSPLGCPGTAVRPDVVPWGRLRSLASTRRAMPDADDAARMFAYRRWRDESGAVLNAARDGLAYQPPGCPALILASTNDDDTPAVASHALARQLGADFELIGQASHLGPLLGRSAARAAERTSDWLRARMPV